MKNLKQRLSYLLVADESVENRLKKVCVLLDQEIAYYN